MTTPPTSSSSHGARRRASGQVVLALLIASPLLARSETVLCPVRRLSGRRCPFCGLTRSLAALRRGDLRESVRRHPLGPPAVLAAIACLLPTRSIAFAHDTRRRRWPSLT
ncbi:MAG TPA: DUF2752 domain-containing protein [Solirubrobacteraceae bacterium]|nr:DUF2752 domain-containing protein [Solirubrobacteraceae bacterium]